MVSRKLLFYAQQGVFVPRVKYAPTSEGGHNDEAMPSVKFHVLVIDIQAVDTAVRRRDPSRDLANLEYTLHQAADKRTIRLRRQPFRLSRVKHFLADRLPSRVRGHMRPTPHAAPKSRTRQGHAKIAPRTLNQLIPARHAHLAILDVRIASHFVHGIAHGDLFGFHAALAIRDRKSTRLN